jgi:hypothetical protein
MSGHNNEINLQRLFRQLAATSGVPALPATEARLREACRMRRKRRLRNRLWTVGIGLAACFLIALLWQSQTVRRHGPAPEINYAGFMALPYSQSDVPMEQAVVVRVNLRPMDLENLGLPSTAIAGKKAVQADLLIGQDGVARAVRLTQ